MRRAEVLLSWSARYVCGTVTGRLRAGDKVRRDAKVVADRTRGLTWATIGERHGLTPRACQMIWSQRASREPATLLIDPEEALFETLEQLERLAEDCALLWESTRNDSIKVAALKQRHAIMVDRFRLLMAVGVLPPTLGRFADEVDANAVAHGVMELLDRHGLDDSAFEELRSLLRPQRRGPTDLPLLECEAQLRS